MGLFTRDRAPPARIEPTLGRVERRDLAVDADSGWFGLATMAGVGSYAGNPRYAENLATVVACVNAVSSGLAALPALVYRAEGKGPSGNSRIGWDFSP